MSAQRPPATLEPVRAWLAAFAPEQLALLIREAPTPAPLTLLAALALLLRPGVGLTPAEVRLYGLHRQPPPPGGAGAFIGEAPWAARCRRWNRRSSRLLSDKLSLSYLLAGSRLAGPRTLAYLGVEAPLLAVPALHDGASLVAFLRQAPYPLFLKPLRGSQGRGCLAIEALENGALRLGDGQRLPLAQAAAALRLRLGRRAIVQERLVPHPLLQAVCGDTCPTVRVLSRWRNDGVQLLAAILKLPGAGAMVDNLHAASGSRPVALVPVDPASGGLGPWRRFDGLASQPIDPPLPLAAIPHWPQVREMVTSLHPLDRGAVLLGWDVAITAGGAVLVEVNGTPGVDLWQLAAGRGFGDDQGQRLLAELDATARWIQRRRWRRARRWLALRPGRDPAGAPRAG
ncbi:MAG: sugar-transfer associated ATP-grasp domain-containing protein [Cyanobacteriota bacterium]|nr:sugar-transfer associated ATP-grasp domain-containing protein [Cyanobacteriota bacterium]